MKRIPDAAGLRAVDVKMNEIDGCSFAVTATRQNDPRRGAESVVDWMLQQEERMGLATPRPYRLFEERVFQHRLDLVRLLEGLRADGKTVIGYGASTKGNVVLQSAVSAPSCCPASPRSTPGSHIPIVLEAEARAMKPDYMLVLPWHFGDNIMRREETYLQAGGRLIFPVPEIEIV